MVIYIVAVLFGRIAINKDLRPNHLIDISSDLLFARAFFVRNIRYKYCIICPQHCPTGLVHSDRIIFKRNTWTKPKCNLPIKIPYALGVVGPECDYYDWSCCIRPLTHSCTAVHVNGIIFYICSDHKPWNIYVWIYSSLKYRFSNWLASIKSRIYSWLSIMLPWFVTNHNLNYSTMIRDNVCVPKQSIGN